jgi:hypothetical protein
MWHLLAMAIAATPVEVDSLLIDLPSTGPPVLHGTLTGATPGSWQHNGVTLVLTDRIRVSKGAKVLLDVPRNHTFLNQVLDDVYLSLDSDSLAILRTYGAAWASTSQRPTVVSVPTEADRQLQVDGWATSSVTIGDRVLTTQTAAAHALSEARDELKALGVHLIPGSNTPSARTWATTHNSWRQRLTLGLDYWVQQGTLESDDKARILALPPNLQLKEALKLEDGGMYLNKHHNRPILSSVAAPGSSQHCWMLAVDLKPHTPKVVEVMASHGWFRTVWADRPHFTWLGVPEDQLPALGLKLRMYGEDAMWVPDL